ncbi:hypothetical protein [Liquorilactobacillus hordei]|uniref:Beta-carotene 15,15'-monooxygenase n=1 Tax=Liquorilactobacillus hordei TaxID=468911 RepID=A0A3Q8C8K9_9LACO|nr:hypothetical protein [Liquorilactobacillus hordei]AUJ29046.1 hypothetical protein BSQ49_01765 [Liquorilactobacillus hordei]
MSKNLLKASYGEIGKILTKKKIYRYAFNIGPTSSMSFLKRLGSGTGLIVFFGIISYGIGIGMPEDIVSSGLTASDVNYISLDTAKAIGFIVMYTKPIELFVWGIYMLMSFLLIFPKKNFARQLFFGTSTVVLFGTSICILAIPFCFGLTLGGFGPVGFILQFLLACYFIFSAFRGSVVSLKRDLYGVSGESSAKGLSLKVLRRVLLSMVVVIMLNQYLFKIGHPLDASVYSLIYGWGVLVWSIAVVSVIKTVFRQTVSTYYFAKYDEQFRESLHFSDEEWYGKRKARRLKKKREQQGR